MPGLTDDDFGQRARQLRVDTLIRLRWLAVAGQSAAVLITRFGLGFDLPIVWCFLCIGMSALLNFGLRLRFPVSQRLDDIRATNILGFDILQLAALLFLTGGVVNPFSILFLAPVMISAASLPLRRTIALLLLALACTTVLTFWHRPLPWVAGADFELPRLYGVAIWAAIAVGAAFITIYANRVAEEARLLAGALNATELVLAREQHLSQLDGLAAAAAHELGTPLATVALVVTEMTRQNPPVGGFRRRSAAAHSGSRPVPRDIGQARFARRRQRGAARRTEPQPSHRGDRRAASRFRRRHRNRSRRAGPEPICRRNPGMLYGLGNIAENAVDFARRNGAHPRDLEFETVTIVIADDGPGVAPHVLARLGEPYVTTRGGDQETKTRPAAASALACSSPRPCSSAPAAQCASSTRSPRRRGPQATVVWPRAAFEQGRQGAKSQ